MCVCVCVYVYARAHFTMTTDLDAINSDSSTKSIMNIIKYAAGLVLALIFLWPPWILVGHAQNTTTTRRVNVGVVLDLAQTVGKMGLSCINMPFQISMLLILITTQGWSST